MAPGGVSVILWLRLVCSAPSFEKKTYICGKSMGS